MSLGNAVTDEVRRRMRARRMSQNELARAVGMPATLIHRAMKRQRLLSLDELEQIAGVLGVTPETLIRQARKASPPSG